MTVAAAQLNRWEYIGDASDDTFPYTSRIFDEDDLVIYLNEALQASNYTVTGVGDPDGGTVVFDTPPGLDVRVTIVREVTDEQPAAIPLGGPLPSVLIERELDRRTIISQQLSENQERTLIYRISDQGLPSPILPALDELKGKYLKFDATTGAPIAADISVAGAFSTADAHTWPETQTFNAPGVPLRIEGSDASPGAARPTFVLARLNSTLNSEVGTVQRRALDSAGIEVTYSEQYTEIQDNTVGVHKGEDHFDLADGAGGMVNWLLGTEDGPAITTGMKLMLDDDRDSYIFCSADDTIQLFTDNAVRVQIGPTGHFVLNNGPRIVTGTGSPEGVVTADVGSLFLRTDGGADSVLYTKETGTGNTGWSAMAGV